MAIEIVSFPMKNRKFPQLFVCLPEGICHDFCHVFEIIVFISPPFSRLRQAAGFRERLLERSNLLWWWLGGVGSSTFPNQVRNVRIWYLHWIGLRENLNRKPWFLPSNCWGFPVNFPIIQFYDIWLVVDLPLWKMMEWKSVGMMTFPTEWENT